MCTSTFISDTFGTFKAKKKNERFALKLKISWKFTLEKSPWWGIFYERCLKRVLEKVFLNCDELTLLIEIEKTLNTRPLTYLSDNNEDEAIRPSHQLHGRIIACRSYYVLCYRIL